MMKSKIAIALFAVFGFAALGVVYLYASRPVPFTPSSAAVDPRFTKADLNKDGKLDQQEFEQYLVTLNKMKMVKVSQETTAGECSTDNADNAAYANEGSYMESALGYAFVPVKSVSETVVTKSKEGGCCGKKKEKEMTASTESGGCCGKKKEKEITASTESGGCCGKKL
jgi:hypothetical protein